MTANGKLIEVRGLKTYFETEAGIAKAVDGVEFDAGFFHWCEGLGYLVDGVAGGAQRLVHPYTSLVHLEQALAGEGKHEHRAGHRQADRQTDDHLHDGETAGAAT